MLVNFTWPALPRQVANERQNANITSSMRVIQESLREAILMSETTQFFVGISPILLIMLGTIGWGGYEAMKIYRRHRH